MLPRRKTIENFGMQFMYKTQDEYEHPSIKDRTTQQYSLSPSPVVLELPTTSKSHSYCFMCKRTGPKIIFVQLTPRFEVYIHLCIFVLAGVSCCPVHLDAEQFTDVASDKIKRVRKEVFLSKTNITLLLENDVCD